jgi:hypothetical protein
MNLISASFSENHLNRKSQKLPKLPVRECDRCSAVLFWKRRQAFDPPRTARLKVPLFDHQKYALAWMVRREHEVDAAQTLHPLFVEYRVRTAFRFFRFVHHRNF